MDRRIFWLCGLVVVAPGVATAEGSAGTYGTASPRYGTTSVTVPQPALFAKVDAHGVVTAGTTANVKVAHGEAGICHPVSAVVVSGGATDRFAAVFSPARTQPNACAFTDATFAFPYPGVSPTYKAEVDRAVVAACNGRGGTSAVVAHPLVRGLRVRLFYGDPRATTTPPVDDIAFPAPAITATCEACPKLAFKSNLVEVDADQAQSFDLGSLVDGDLAPYAFTMTGAVPGMTVQGQTLSGTPVAGRYPVRLSMFGTCATGRAGATADAVVLAKYGKVELTYASAAPSWFRAIGGRLDLEARVTSQVNITQVRARIVGNGKTFLAPITLVSGNPLNGVWKGYWSVPRNDVNAAVSYEVLFESTDDKGRISILTEAKTIPIQVLAGPPTSGAPAAPGTATGNAPSPVPGSS